MNKREYRFSQTKKQYLYKLGIVLGIAVVAISALTDNERGILNGGAGVYAGLGIILTMLSLLILEAAISRGAHMSSKEHEDTFRKRWLFAKIGFTTGILIMLISFFTREGGELINTGVIAGFAIALSTISIGLGAGKRD
jgi:hypothetical protein